MILRISRNRSYQVAAVALIPVAVYNLYVWSVNEETRWQTDYLKSLVGGLGCSVLAIILIIVSCIRQDRIYVLGN